jgi:hypothetical protein
MTTPNNMDRMDKMDRMDRIEFSAVILETIVQAVMTASYHNKPIIPHKITDPVISRALYDPSEEINNPKSEFINAATSFVTNEYFKNNDTRLYFFSIINDLFTNVLQIYAKKNNLSDKDLIFVYKGGNILRIIYINYIKKIPKCARDILKKDFDDNFKKSDMDFNILINPNIKNYDKVRADVKNIIFLTLNIVRGIIGLEHYFVTDYFKYIDEVKVKLLTNLMDEMSTAETLKNEKSPYYNFKFIGLELDGLLIGQSESSHDTHKNVVKKDLIIRREKNLELSTDIITYQIENIKVENKLYKDQVNNKYFNTLKDYLILLEKYQNYNDKFMYISLNDEIEYLTSSGLTIKFDLMRIKSNCKLFLLSPENTISELNLGAEMIDIGISYPDDHLKELFSNLKSKLYIYPYDIPPIIRQRKFQSKGSFIGYNLNYSIIDLEYILFDVVTLPWTTVKYDKRLKRVVFLYYVSLLADLTDKKKVKEIIEVTFKHFEEKVPVTIDPKLKIHRLIKENMRIIDTSKDEVDYLKFKGIIINLLKVILKSISIIELEESFVKHSINIDINVDKTDLVGGIFN